MDEIKEIFESLRSRIKSPFFGHAFFFAIFINWKVWFYLFFANIDVVAKFTYFDDNTTYNSLILVPLGFAILSSFISPWIKLFFIWLTAYPTTQKNILQVRAENKIISEKNRIEKLNAESQTIKEESIISMAERDAKVKNIKDKAARESAQKEIEHSRISATLRKDSDNDSYRFYISNNGSTIVNNLDFKLLLNNSSRSPLTNDYEELFPLKVLHPGDEVSVRAIITLDMASKFNSSLSWTDSSGIEHKKLSTITF